tara:strand:- start:2860 stop:3279 length:420 start_codon:yes stop_codon:yes gene_type:complete
MFQPNAPTDHPPEILATIVPHRLRCCRVPDDLNGADERLSWMIVCPEAENVPDTKTTLLHPGGDVVAFNLRHPVPTGHNTNPLRLTRTLEWEGITPILNIFTTISDQGDRGWVPHIEKPHCASACIETVPIVSVDGKFL